MQERSEGELNSITRLTNYLVQTCVQLPLANSIGQKAAADSGTLVCLPPAHHPVDFSTVPTTDPLHPPGERSTRCVLRTLDQSHSCTVLDDPARTGFCRT